MLKRLAVLLIVALVFGSFNPIWGRQQAQASGAEVVRKANKDVFIDNAAPYDQGAQANQFMPAAQSSPNSLMVNVVGPDNDFGNQKTAINFSGLKDSDIPSTISSVTLRVFVPFLYIHSPTYQDVRVTVNASDNTSWAEGLGGSIGSFPADNNDSRLDISGLQNVKVADANGTAYLNNSSSGCGAITNVLLGCLDLDVTDYVTNKISGPGGASDITFLLSGRLNTGETSYFSIYPDENSTYAPQLIFSGSSNAAPTDLSLSGSVAENQLSGATVGTLSATDSDPGETFTYALVSGTGSQDNSKFSITGNTLRTATMFNYESGSVYSIRVRVTDSASNTYEEALTVSVTNVNEAPTDIALTAGTIGENAASGTTVGTLSATDPDAGGSYMYSLVAGSGDDGNGYFSIMGNTLKTNAALDFESHPSYSIRVRVTDNGGLTFEKIFPITVTDGNDAPTALTLSATSLVENKPAGTTIGTLSTTDSNTGDTFTYSLVSGGADNASFSISGDKLVTNAVLDYESKDSYSIRVRTTDNGGLSVDEDFTITLTDGNDAPTDITLTGGTVAENEAIGTAAGTLSAADIDAGESFTYTLVSGAGDDDNAKFGITGNELKTQSVLNFEDKSTYSIRVQVTDSANHTFEKPFNVTAANVNEAPTAIALTGDEIAENTASGSTVGAFSATDPDAGETFTYALVSGADDTDNSKFSITGNTLTTATVVDYESQQAFSIRVRVTDSANNTYEETFAIGAANVNEAPTDIALTGDEMDENAASGSTVGTFGTTDPDVGGSYTYSLVSGSGDDGNSYFSVTGNTLTTNAALDFESNPSHSIRVQVTDNGGLTLEKTFTITVTDGNDAPTALTLSATDVAENKPSGTTIGTLSTTDSNTGDTFTYSLVSGGADNASFSISGDKLVTNAVLDYESKDSYSIRVRTTDNGGLSVDKDFAITVTDGNDAPTDITLTGGTVAENEAIGTAAGTLSAADIDAGESFTYALVSGAGDDDNAKFEITGNEVKTRSVLDFEDKSTYSIRVQVTDSASHTFEKSFSVSATNVNEAPTDIALTSDEIDENMASGSTVGTFSATDPDTGETFTYTLVSGADDTDNSKFNITGNALTTAAAIDYESQQAFSIRVRVTDSANNTYEETFAIGAANVNEAPMDITLTGDEMDENAVSGATVGTFSTADPDAGGSYTYSLVAGSGDDGNSYFSIAGNTLTTNAALDFETHPSHSIRVQVTDNGGLTLEKTFTITVTDGNDAPTALTLSATDVAENKPSGTTVGTLSTTDSNTGDTFTYSLVSGGTDNASFSISGDKLVTNAVLDYESKDSYSIRVRTTDAGGLSVEEDFTITVTDGNDAPTDITLAGGTVAENAAIGTAAGTLSATDIDAGESFTFTLVNGAGDDDNAKFELDGNTLKTNGAFNYEAKSSYPIRVRVTDAFGNTYEQAFDIAATNVNEAPTGSIVINDGDSDTGSDTVVLTLTSADPEGDALQMRFSNNGTDWSDWEAFAASKTWSLDSADGAKTVYMQLQDTGNLSSETYQAGMMKDTTAPTGTIAINGSDATARHRTVSLTITSTDGGGNGGIQARFSNDNDTWTDWENAPGEKEWTLTAGKGTKTVYMQLKDALGNTSASIIYAITYKSLPQLGDVSKSVQGNVQLAAADFPYSDEDGSELQSVKLISLPENGKIKLKDTDVTVNQEIALADLDKLAYLPPSGWSGTDKLVWNAFDGDEYADADATISFITKAEETAPTPVDPAPAPVDPAPAPVDPAPAPVDPAPTPVDPAPAQVNTSPAATQDEAVIVIVNGVMQDQLATARTETGADGRKVSTIMIDEQKMGDKLAKEGKHAVVMIPFMKATDRVVAVLNGRMVQTMDKDEAVLQVQTSNVLYTIPAWQINMGALSSQFGKQVDLKDLQVKVSIEMLSPTSDKVKQLKAKNGQLTVVAPVVEFKLIVSYNGKDVEITQFSAFVERAIAIPDGTDPHKITTGVVAKPDGTLVHVPTKIVNKDGRYYAVINSLTNSVYTVVFNEKSMEDVEHHWSKAVVNEMAARLVITGVDEEHFAPDQAITRAEFTAIVVRALGLREAHQDIAFADVGQQDWFYTAVAIGQEYGLIQGYSASKFAPDQPISRQEAMVIMERALKLAGHTSALSGDQIAAQLSVFRDREAFAEWAKAAAAYCIQLDIVKGSEGAAHPASNITRAETAAIVKRMLEAAQLI